MDGYGYDERYKEQGDPDEPVITKNQQYQYHTRNRNVKRGVGVIKPEYVVKKEKKEYQRHIYSLAGTGYKQNSRMEYEKY